MQRVRAIDVFCGAGGLSLGLQSSGIEVAAGIDLDPACRYPFEFNIKSPFLEADVANLKARDLANLFAAADVRVLAGCAPCQPFSGYTTRRRSVDERWTLLLDFLRLAVDLRPEVITMENVPRLVHLPLWKEFVSGLEGAGYRVAWRVLNAADFGVPQHRRRLVLLASNLGDIELPDPHSEQPISVRSAIGGLPGVAAGAWDTDDRLHASRALTRINLDRIRASRPSGTWREWPEDMKTDCHRRSTGRTYPSVYGRMSWDAPSPTITTQFYGFGNGRFGHPEQDRALTLREGAILQSFPPSFRFSHPKKRINFKEIGRLIGNAVPPSLAKAIGYTILDHIVEKKPEL